MYPATKMLIVMLVLFFACVILAAIFGERFWAPAVWAFGAVVFTAYRFMVRKRTTLPSAKPTISWTNFRVMGGGSPHSCGHLRDSGLIV